MKHGTKARFARWAPVVEAARREVGGGLAAHANKQISAGEARARSQGETNGQLAEFARAERMAERLGLKTPAASIRDAFLAWADFGGEQADFEVANSGDGWSILVPIGGGVSVYSVARGVNGYSFMEVA